MIPIFSFKILVTVLGCINVVTSNHFRGGSIFWKPTGNGYEVEFSAKLGWAYGTYSCSSSNLNVYQTKSIATWKCDSGCPVKGTVVNAKTPGYTCTGFDSLQNWERTDNTFSYTFPGPGPYNIEHTGGLWINALGSGNWRLLTTVNLHTRSDTLAPNFSPVVPTKPVYYVKYGCKETLRLPVSDADGDNVSCRWSTGTECVSVCYSAGKAPVATLQTNCDLTIDATHKKSGVYALAITIEDKPTSTITIGSTTYAPSRVIASVPLQFVLETPDLPTRSCSDKPIFLDPTPSQNDVLVYKPGDIVYLSFYATSRAATIKSFTLLDPPTNVRQSALRKDDMFRPSVYAIDITWTPVAADKGSKTICIEATDSYMMSTQHCVTLVVWDINPCDSSPCQNNGTCERQRYTDNYNCACVPGFTGHNCEIDINECASGPCLHNGTCFDLVNEFFCGCQEGYTGYDCGTDINECEAQPCEHGGTCVDLVGSSVCLCKPGFTGTICQTGVDFCETLPCENDGICRYNESSVYMCECLDGWVGRNCGYRLESKTFFLGNKTGMTDEYLHYSDCDCVLGSGRQDYCYMYTLNKHSGFGILAILLGILSSIILYFLFYCVFDGFHNRISQDRVQEEKDEVSDKHPQQNEDVKASSTEKLDAPKQRRHHCWACEVKYNNAPAPLWYKKDFKKY